MDVPDAPDQPQQRILALFGQLKGPGFDCAYTPREFSDHENDVARFESSTPSSGGRSPGWRAGSPEARQTSVLHQPARVAGGS